MQFGLKLSRIWP